MKHGDGESWSGRAGFVLAALGCAIGIGNVWRFAYVAGDNGGGAFLLVYVACVLLIGVPLLLSELVLGSRARADVLQSFSHPRALRAWRAGGVLAVLVAFLILSYYSVIAGWVCKYFLDYAIGAHPGTAGAAPEESFRAFVADPLQPLAWHALFMALTAAVVAAGIEKGIERASRVLMPVLAVLILLLAGYALSLPGAEKGIAFLFAPDWSALAAPKIYLAALGQAFFSLGVGMGVIITYAGYLRSNEGLAASAVAIAAGDTLFAVAAGVAIFPIVFSFGMDPAYGPALAFVTLPKVFALMPGGAWFGVAFFFLLSAAALTSSVSLLEVPVAIAQHRGWPRAGATALVAFCAFLAGAPSSLGTGPLGDVRIAGRGILEAVDFVAADLFLPVSGIAVALFTGWVLPRGEALGACGLSPRAAGAWLAAVRYVVPAALLAILGVLAFG
ncbi:MAG: sodium-dependent transporter [Betaproteobacteria bacterium]|nr:sodium-dependent transporter [Betaproteobacteria bacterium]